MPIKFFITQTAHLYWRLRAPSWAHGLGRGGGRHRKWHTWNLYLNKDFRSQWKWSHHWPMYDLVLQASLNRFHVSLTYLKSFCMFKTSMAFYEQELLSFLAAIFSYLLSLLLILSNSFFFFHHIQFVDIHSAQTNAWSSVCRPNFWTKTTHGWKSWRTLWQTSSPKDNGDVTMERTVLDFKYGIWVSLCL